MHEIEDNLRTIRRLMERGQRYEAITGRGALLGGIAALGVAALVGWITRSDPFGWGRARELAFHVAWMLLALSCVAWVARAALKLPAGPGDTAPNGGSSAARAVLRAVLPAYLAAAALTASSLVPHDNLPGTWTCLHGVAILATAYHAPRRLVVLGWLFLALGSVLLALRGLTPWHVEANAAMALGFGGLNIGYGLFSLLRPLPAED